jgi:hypothetical protein
MTGTPLFVVEKSQMLDEKSAKLCQARQRSCRCLFTPPQERTDTDPDSHTATYAHGDILDRHPNGNSEGNADGNPQREILTAIISSHLTESSCRFHASSCRMIHSLNRSGASS